MTIKEIMKLDGRTINKLSSEQLREYIKIAGKVAEDRRTDFFNKMKEYGIRTTSYAHQELYKPETLHQQGVSSFAEYDFSLTGKENHNLLKNKFSNILRYLNDETSQPDKWLEVMTDFADRIERASALKISKSQYDRLWRLYNRLEQQYRADPTVQKMASTQLQETIYKTMSNKRLLHKLYGDNTSLSENEKIDRIFEYIDEIGRKNYEKSQNSNSSTAKTFLKKSSEPENNGFKSKKH